MSLSSSLFSGISGLNTLGNSMSVIGDNIANVNTVGFKSSRVTFQDVLSQTVATTAGSTQVGRGTSLSDISSSFSQGSFESTDSTTDLAIGGEGFFIVRDKNSVENNFYTRAGEFRFDKDGNFVNPSGYIVRGWSLNQETGEDQGTIRDIQLESFTSSPAETSLMTAITNLNADAESKSLDLAAQWDGADANDEYIGDNKYEYQTTVKCFDSLGSTHDITMYCDKGQTASSYEFILACVPGEDQRTDVGVASTDAGLGMLGKGVITFNDSSGTIEDVAFSKFIGDGAANPGMDITDTSGLAASTSVPTLYHNLEDTAATADVYTFTVPAGGPFTIGTNACTITWAGAGPGGAGSFTIPATYTSGTILDSTDGLPPGMELAFSTGTLVSAETFEVTAANGDSDDLSSAYSWADISTGHQTDGYFTYNADFLGGNNTDMDVKLNLGSYYNDTTGNWVNDSLSTTQFSSASTTIFQAANGYGAGDLQSITVATDGVITGQYSNGQVLSLYRVALAKFQNEQGLYKEGGNLFAETRLSGDPITGKPGTNGLGSLSPNSLEQSNVDLAKEFVKMITTQRGFQANSKIITVTDQMLAELIQLKR